MQQKLNIVVVANSEAMQNQLSAQLSQLPFVSFAGVLLELGQAAQQWQNNPPDVILVDLTGQELEAGLFIQTVGMNPDSPCEIFALHEHMDPTILVESIRNGAKEVIHYPLEAQKLEASLKKHYTVLNRSYHQAQHDFLGQNTDSEKTQGKLLSVFSPKGGAGTSTLAVNLAYELRLQTQESVALLDLDQTFNNTAVLLNLKPAFSLADLGSNNVAEMDEVLFKKILTTHESGMDLIVACKNVLDENDLVSPEILEKTLQYLRSHYAYVVVDLPTHVLDAYHQFMVSQSDSVLLVSCLDVPGLYRTRQYLDLAKRHINLDKLKLVLNRWNLRAAYGMTNKNLEEEFKCPVFSRLVNDWELNVEANSLGVPLRKVNEKAELVKCIQKLAEQIVLGPSSNSNAEANPSAANAKAALGNNGSNKGSHNGGFLGKLFAKRSAAANNSTNSQASNQATSQVP